MQDYDINLIKSISSNVNIVVIASRGCTHMLDVLSNGGTSAVAAVSIFHFTEQTPSEARDYLSKNGIAVHNVNY